MHAWLNINIRHQADWPKVSLYLSSSFLSKNQLARDGPDSVAPVVIPALSPSLGLCGFQGFSWGGGGVSLD